MTESKGKKTARTVVSMVFAFVLSLLFIIGTALVLVRVGVFEHKSFRSLMDEDYYNAVLDNFVRQAEDYTLPTNIDISVLQNVFMLDEAKRDVNGYVKAAFNGEDYTPNTEAARLRLRENLNAFFAENEVEVGDDIDSIVEEYINEIFDIYDTKMRMPGIELILKARDKYVRYVHIGLAVCAGLAAVMIGLIIGVNRRTHSSLRYIAYSTLAAALMSFAAPAWIYFSGRYSNLNLAPEYFYRFVTGYIKHMLELCFFTAGIWLLITVLIFFIMALSRSRSKERATEE